MRKTPRLKADMNQLAYDVVQAAIGEGPRPQLPGKRTDKNPEAAKRGREGGLKGGKVRASKISADKRREAARLAAQARWKKG